MMHEGENLPHINEEELSTLVETALFAEKLKNNQSVKEFIFCIFQRDDLQAILGWSALNLLTMDKPDFSFFPLFVNHNDVTTTIINTHLQYRDKIDDFKIFCIGDGLDVNHDKMKHIDNIIVIKTRPRNPVPKSITESLFEEFIITKLSHDTPYLLDYKIISDLSLTLLDYEQKINKFNNPINIEILLSKTIDMLYLFNIHPKKDRTSLMDFIGSELHKYILLFGAPY